MQHQPTSRIIQALVLAGGMLPLAGSGLEHRLNPQQITPAPQGPFHVNHAEILDSRGRAFLMRGTELTPFRLQTALYDNRGGREFGAHSATTLTAARLRFNMNTVRLPLDIVDAAGPAYFAELSRVVRRANDLELLVILAAREPSAPLPTDATLNFWSRCAATFKDSPNVMFDAFSDPQAPAGVDAHSAQGWQVWRRAMSGVVRAIRSAGAQQPVLVMGWKDDQIFRGFTDAALLEDPNIIYEASGNYAGTRTDAQRDAQFGFLASRFPVAANGWDLALDDPAVCSSIPADPALAGRMVQGNLDYLDQRNISWTMSQLAPGKLIKDLSLHDASSLEDGFICGRQKYPAAGLGRLLEGHLRSTEERSIFVVSAGGGVDLPRGGFANGYGPVMAAHDASAHGPRLPLKLGGISVQVTDAAGVTRPAGIYWVSAGWGQVNFVIPDESAPGRARMTLVRDDGSRLGTNIVIADTAPGFRTGLSCRGAAVGAAVRAGVTTPISECRNGDCTTIAVPVTNGQVTRLQLRASGFRHAASSSDIHVTIGGIAVPVVSYGPAADPGMDDVTVALPSSLRNVGETDLVAHVNGRVANVVRVRIGGAVPVS